MNGEFEEPNDAVLRNELEACVGRDHLRSATADDAVSGRMPRYVVEPATPAEVARVLASANRAGASVIPRGGGSKLDWGEPPRTADLILSLRRLDAVLEHAAGDMTATVEAGCPVETLQQALGEHGQRLALDPLWPGRATVGGLLATGDSGALRWTYGPPRDLVLGMTVVLADGTLARSGGKVVKNVAGYDLPKLLTGSFGTLGVITQATFRLHPLPEANRTLEFRLPSAKAVQPFVEAMNASALMTSAVQLRAEDGVVLADVGLEGPAAAIEVKSRRVIEAATAAGAMVTAAETTVDLWRERERLFEVSDASFAVCKISLLPTSLAALAAWLDESTFESARWRFVAQATGLMLIRIDAESAASLATSLRQLRERTTSAGGSLVVVRRSPDVAFDDFSAWPAPKDCLPLMRRIKQQFDPEGTLNPGRFVGGI